MKWCDAGRLEWKALRIRSAAGLCLGWAGTLFGETFAGGGVGLSILSGDARAVTAGGTAAASFYDAGKGAIAHGFVGRRVHEYVGVQGAYLWTRNAVSLQSVSGAAFREQRLEVAQQQAGADFLLFFRDSKSWIQPFLSVGAGVTGFSGSGDGARVSGQKAALRVAAGVDVMSRRGWGFRYAFLETISANPISGALSPPGTKGLMTFQNLFGVVWRR
jgi:hypothetical protein